MNNHCIITHLGTGLQKYTTGNQTEASGKYNFSLSKCGMYGPCVCDNEPSGSMKVGNVLTS